MKTCRGCGDEKPLNEFHRQNAKKDGRQSQCRACRSNTQKVYRQKPEVATRIKAYNAEYNQRPGVKEKQRKYRQRPEHKEKQRTYAQQPEIITRRREYQKTPRGKEVAQINQTRRLARKRELPNTLTSEQWEDCLVYWEHKCANCATTEMIETDHWIPISYKGVDNPGTVAGNIIPLCVNCNRSKRIKLPKEWASNELIEQVKEYFNHVKDAYHRR